MRRWDSNSRGSPCCSLTRVTSSLTARPFASVMEWNVYCPRVIPTMTVLGLTCGFSLIRGLWPVWGLLTPLILGLVAMACLMSLHFIPIPC